MALSNFIEARIDGVDVEPHTSARRVRYRKRRESHSVGGLRESLRAPCPSALIMIAECGEVITPANTNNSVARWPSWAPPVSSLSVPGAMMKR